MVTTVTMTFLVEQYNFTGARSFFNQQIQFHLVLGKHEFDAIQAVLTKHVKARLIAAERHGEAHLAGTFKITDEFIKDIRDTLQSLDNPDWVLFT